MPAATDLRLVPAALAAWFVAGLTLAWPAAVATWTSVATAAMGVAVVQAARWRARRGPARHRALGAPGLGAALALAAVAVTLAVVAVAVHARSEGWWGTLVRDSATVRVEAVVRAGPQAVTARTEGRGAPQVRVRVEVRDVIGRGGRADAHAPVLVLGPRGWADLHPGEVVRADGRLVAVDPGDDVVALLTTTQPPERVDPGGPVSRAVGAVRAGLLRASADLPPDQAGLVPGIALGDTSQMPPGLEDAMRAVSLTHVTAVSGAHVAIILGVVLAVTGRLPRAVRAGVAVLTLVAFVVVVEPGPSVLRAAAMGAVASLGILLGRPSRAVPALALAVILLVLLDPWAARSFGFALSVLATAGVVLLAPVLARRWSRRLPGWLAHGLAVPAAAQAACGPVVILLQPSLPLLAVPANALAALAVPPATVMGVLATTCGTWWHSAALVLARGSGVFAAWIAGVARRAAEVPGAQLPWPAGVPGAMLLAVVSLAAGLLAVRGPWRMRAVRRTVIIGGLAVLLAVLPGPRRELGRLLPGGWPPARWEAIACDVGQGAALAVRSGPDAAVVVDAGPPGDAARRCLDVAGVHTVDLLVLTHLHDDHVGGLPGVLAGRRVHAAIVTPYPEPSAARREVAALLGRAGIPVATPALPDAGDRRVDESSPADVSGVAGSVRWDVLSPLSSAVAGASGMDGTTVNDLGLALLLRTPTLTLAALGDAERSAQSALATGVRRARAERAPGGAGAMLGVDVVVVAHHGSARQDPGLAALLAAPVALISVGAGNPYGHPDPETVALYGDAGGVVLRTDECGAVAVLTGPLGAVSRCRTPGAGPSRPPGRARRGRPGRPACRGGWGVAG